LQNFWHYAERIDGFVKRLAPCRSAGTDLQNIWRYAERIDGFVKRLAPCRSAGTDLQNIWRYAGFYGGLSILNWSVLGGNIAVARRL
jgi:hypothetical protein